MDKRLFTPEDFAPATMPELPPNKAHEAPRRKRITVGTVAIAVLGLIILGAVLFPLLSPFDYATQNVAFAGRPFFSRDPITEAVHIFGTDLLGRDIFVRVWTGVRISLLVAVVVAILDCAIGVVYGSIAGYFGGAVDNIMMRLLEVISGIPYLVVVLLMMAVLPQGILTLIVAYTLVGWTGMARLVRGQVASLMGREFMIATRITGAGMGRVMLRHLVPNMRSIITVNITLDIPSVMFTEAFLSMLGLGVPPPYPSLGTLVNEGAAVFQIYPSRLAVPGLFICVIMLAFHLLGDHLQEHWDPKNRRLTRSERNSKSGTATRHL